MPDGGSPSDSGPPLRVLQVCTNFTMGGIQRHVLNLGDWLTARGVRVSYAGSPGAWLNGRSGRDFLPLGLDAVAADGAQAPLIGRLAALGRSAASLSAWLKRNPVDVIHTHESAPLLAARLAALGSGAPIVVTYHGSHLGRAPQFGKIARTAANAVVTVSRQGADDLHELGGVPRGRLHVIGLGVRPPPPARPEVVQRLRRELLGEDGRFLVVTVARLTEQKGIDVLVDVAARVTAERPDVRFAVVGDGPLSEAACGWAKAAGLGDRLRFVGASEQPHFHLAAADLFLLTSRWEGLPLAIAEAFQAGLPAVATDCGGVRELIDEAVGAVRPVDDAAGLAQSVLDIAADPARRDRLAAAALERSHEPRFKPEFNHMGLEALYRQLARVDA